MARVGTQLNTLQATERHFILDSSERVLPIEEHVSQWRFECTSMGYAAIRGVIEEMYRTTPSAPGDSTVTGPKARVDQQSLAVVFI